MLLVFAPRDPHLVKCAQTGEDAAPDPAPEFPLGQGARSVDPHARARVRRAQFLVQTLREPMD